MKTRILIVSAGLAASAFAYAPAPIVFDTPAEVLELRLQAPRAEEHHH